jgi:formyl-CoA transferase
VTALYERERTGEGQMVEVSMFESTYPSLMSSLGLLFGTGGKRIPAPTGNRHNGLAEAPYNVYEVADGYVAIICVTDAHWRTLAGLMGREDLAEHPLFATRRARVQHIDEVDEVVSAFTRGHSRDALFALLQAHRVPCAPVRDLGEVTTDEHLHERGMLREIDHPEFGPITVPHSPLRYHDHRDIPLSPSPTLGEHNEAVFCAWLGMSREEFAELVAQGVV